VCQEDFGHKKRASKLVSYGSKGSTIFKIDFVWITGSCSHQSNHKQSGSTNAPFYPLSINNHPSDLYFSLKNDDQGQVVTIMIVFMNIM